MGSACQAVQAYQAGEKGKVALHAAMAAGELVVPALVGKGFKLAKQAWKQGAIAKTLKKASPKVQAAARKGMKQAEKESIRSLSAPNTLHGATISEINKLIPKDWDKMPLKKGKGVRYINPVKPGESILIEQGWKNTQELLYSGPYVRIARDGKIIRVPLSGNPTL